MKRNEIGLAVLCALSATVAQAADETNKWYINPNVGYLVTDHSRKVDDDIYAGIGFGKHINTQWSIELNGVTGSYDQLGGDLNIDAFSFDGLRVFNRAGRVSPFISMGIGYIDEDLSPSIRDGNGLMQAGGGLFVDLTESASGSSVLQLRPEMKLRWDMANSTRKGNNLDLLIGVGLQWSFGSAPRATQPAIKAIEPPPAPAARPAPPAPVPAPTPPADSDGDGVIDGRDQCPTTPRGEVVDAAGCSYALRLSVQFENDSATLKSQSLPELDTAAALLIRVTNISGVIEGHTDNVGRDAYNLSLSQRRAQAVLDYLTGKGVAASRLQAKGLGESQPEADNTTAEGRAQNRRVILRRTDSRN